MVDALGLGSNIFLKCKGSSPFQDNQMISQNYIIFIKISYENS